MQAAIADEMTDQERGAGPTCAHEENCASWLRTGCNTVLGRFSGLCPACTVKVAYEAICDATRHLDTEENRAGWEAVDALLELIERNQERLADQLELTLVDARAKVRP